MGLNFSEAFRYPGSRPGRLATAAILLPLPILAVPLTLVGGALAGSSPELAAHRGEMALGILGALFVVAVVPCLMVAGYWVRAVRQVAQGDDQLPPWDNWLGLILDGVAAILVPVSQACGPYLLLMAVTAAFVVPAGLLGGAHSAEITRSTATGYGQGFFSDLVNYFMSLAGTAIGLMFLAALGAFGLLLYLVMPISLLRLAVSHSFLSALNPFGIARGILRGLPDYLKYLLVMAGLGVCVHLACGLFPPLLLLALPLKVYTSLVSAHLLGQYHRVHLT